MGCSGTHVRLAPELHPRYIRSRSPWARPIQDLLAGRQSDQNRPYVNTDRYLVTVVSGSSRPGKVQAPFLGRDRKQTRRSLEATTVSGHTLFGSYADLSSRRLGAR